METLIRMKKESRVLRPTDAFKQSVGVSTRARQLPSNKARAASSLKMGEHFEERSLESLEVTEKIHDLLEKLVKDPSGRYPRKDHALAKGVFECAASCHANFMRLHQPVRNEAELRYSIADPIINLLCDYCNLTVALEESIQDNAAGATEIDFSCTDTPNTRMTKRVTERSRSDYTLYSLSTDKSLAVVILEAKMSTNVDHAPAQVLGYVIALAKEMKVVKQGEEDKLQGPMAMIITEEEVQVFLFPFQHDGSVLVTALALAPIKLFCGTTVLDPSSLFLLAFITNNRPLSDITLQGGEFSGEQMRRYDIVTDNEAEIQKLKDELKKKEEESKKEKEELKKEIERLRQLVERERS